jgi:hypothetical protein
MYNYCYIKNQLHFILKVVLITLKRQIEIMTKWFTLAYPLAIRILNAGAGSISQKNLPLMPLTTAVPILAQPPFHSPIIQRRIF